MKKKYYYILSFLIFLIVIGNIKPTRYLFAYLADDRYRYASSSGEFFITDQTGNSLPGIQQVFEEYKKEKNPSPGDTVLYRLFWKNPLYFWRWYSYFNDKRYELPYRSYKPVQEDQKSRAL